MDAEQFRKAAHGAVDEIIDYFNGLSNRRVLSDVQPGYLQPLLPNAPPEEGEEWEDIQKDIEAKIMPGLTHWQSPGFMAFFPANTTYPSLLGELYSAAFTAPAFNWLCSPATTELETIVLDYLCRLLHLPASYLSTSDTGGGGVIQGSASEAIVTVMIAARERYVQSRVEKLNGNRGLGEKAEGELNEAEWKVRSRLVALGSEMAHSSTQKATMITGVKYRSIPLSAADDFALTGKGLRDALIRFRDEEKLEPFYLTVTLGTTATCAVDQFKEISEVKKEFPGLWIHVDAAYAGAALLLEEYKHLTEGMEGFDSFDVNMHKWLLVNFDASCVFLPNSRPVTTALSITPSYLQNSHSESGLVTDYRDWQIPLGRRFRALKIWFVMRSYGVNGLKRHVRRHIELGEKFAGWVRRARWAGGERAGGERVGGERVGGEKGGGWSQAEGQGMIEGERMFEIVATPRFALTVLRCRVPGEKRNEGGEGVLNDDEEGIVNGNGEGGKTETKINEGVARDGVAVQDLSNGHVHDGDDDGKKTIIAEANAVTKEVYERINAGGEIFLTSTMIKDTYTIRVVGANEQTDEAHLRKAFEILVRTTEAVLLEKRKK